MKLRPIISDDVKKGDKIAIIRKLSPSIVEIYTILRIMEYDSSLEVILQIKGNIYFNLDMYLNDESWVKEACIIEP